MEVEVQGRDRFIRLPSCDGPKILNEYLIHWESLAAKHGTHLPDDHLQSMLQNMLLASIRAEVRKLLKDHPVATTPHLIQCLRIGIHQAVGEKVANALRTMLFGDFPGCKVKTVHALATMWKSRFHSWACQWRRAARLEQPHGVSVVRVNVLHAVVKESILRVTMRLWMS